METRYLLAAYVIGALTVAGLWMQSPGRIEQANTPDEPVVAHVERSPKCYLSGHVGEGATLKFDRIECIHRDGSVDAAELKP